MAQATNILLEILRIITPEEVNELTSTSAGNERISLTDFLDLKREGVPLNFDEEAGAKILPFKRRGEYEEKKDETIHAGKNVQEYLLQWDLKQGLNQSAVDKKSGKAVETSTFILREKQRFAYNQNKLKGKEVLDLYAKTSSVDIEQEKVFKDDLSKSARSGVLVNKRQY